MLNDLEARFQNSYALFGDGDLTFEFFRRFLQRFKSLVLHGRANGWTRKQFLDEELIPKFVAPYVAWWLRELNRSPFDFLDLDKLLRSNAPLSVLFDHCLSQVGKSWSDLAEIYSGKAASYKGQEPTHDIDDKKKTVRRWRAGSATPSMETCLELLDGLKQARYTAIVYWTWLARFLQTVDLRYRSMIADAVSGSSPLPLPHDFGEALTERSDEAARWLLSHDAVNQLRTLTQLLFYSKHRTLGDKVRAKDGLAALKASVNGKAAVRYYVTWLEARYSLYCRDNTEALALYEQAFYEGMYGDFQAETQLLPEWAAVAQKVGDRTALKRIDSRMRLLGIYPNGLTAEEVTQLRLRAFISNFGAETCFIESFATVVG